MGSIVIEGGILWILITYFSKSTNSQQSFRESAIVILCLSAFRVITVYALGHLLGWFAIVLDIVALYLLVDKFCGLNRKVTIKICLWYVGICALLVLGTKILMMPVDAQ